VVSDRVHSGPKIARADPIPRSFRLDSGEKRRPWAHPPARNAERAGVQEPGTFGASQTRPSATVPKPVLLGGGAAEATTLLALQRPRRCAFPVESGHHRL